MNKRCIRIDDLNINLRGVDASLANDVSRLLPAAISAQLQRADSHQQADSPIRIKGLGNAAQLAEHIAARVAAGIRRQTKGTEK